jgi:hypothetical protein
MHCWQQCKPRSLLELLQQWEPRTLLEHAFMGIKVIAVTLATMKTKDIIGTHLLEHTYWIQQFL